MSKLAVRDFIKQLNQIHKTTVILTTHDMQDIEALTERILLIGKGQILLDGPLSALRSRSSSRRTLTVSYTGDRLPACEDIVIEEDKGGRAVLSIDTGVLSVSEAIARLSAQTELRDVSVAEESIDELVASLYREFAI